MDTLIHPKPTVFGAKRHRCCAIDVSVTTKILFYFAFFTVFCFVAGPADPSTASTDPELIWEELWLAKN